jgi:hypothetical protein
MHKQKKIVAIALASLIFASLASYAAGVFEGTFDDLYSGNSRKASQDSPSVATSVFEKVSKSVVIVEALSPAGRVQGSGVVYDNHRSILIKEGEADEIPARLPDKLFSYVVTNAHVVKNASNVSVLEGGKRYQADVRYVDDESDLALLYVHGDLLSISPPFSGAQLKVGEKVFAIGSPFGLVNSISEGIISGKRQQNGVLLLQITAPVSRGSSGGGLFDMKGRFVGITTFKLMGGENLNFAVDAGRVSEIEDARGWTITLRTLRVPEDHFSEKELAIIYSDTLTEWILKEKLSAEIRRRWSEVWDSTQARNKFRLQMLARFLSDQVGKTAKPQNKHEIVVIVCTMRDFEGKIRRISHSKLTIQTRW